MEQQRRRLLFPIDPLPNGTGGVSGGGANTPTKPIGLLAMKAFRTLQLNWKIITSGVVLTLLAIIWYSSVFFFFILFVVYSLLLLLAAAAATMYIHHIFTTNKPIKPKREPSNLLYEATKSCIFDLPNPVKNATNLPLIFGKTVDLQLQQIIEYVLRDFMSPWLGYVVTKPKLINDIVREDIWQAIHKLHMRAIQIDASKIIAVDMVNRITVHLEKIRIAEARAAETQSVPVFSTNSYLVDEESEMKYLRKLSDIMLLLLLPRGYSLSPLRVLLSEILSYKIFCPLIKMLTSPDYINQKIVQNIETRMAAAAISKRGFDTASYDEFLKIINNAGNLEELSLIRKSIVNDLMHATTMQNLQRAKGLVPYTDDHCLTKSEMNAAARLKRYVEQLSFAKTQCEENLSKYGWNGNYSSDFDLTLTEILNTAVGRRYLTLFLEPLKASTLVGFYLAVEQLMHAPKTDWHQMGTEIFYAFIRVPKPEIQIDKQERKQIEAFLLGDAGPDILYNIQARILQTLEEKYHAPFVQSEEYRLLKEALNADDYKDSTLLLRNLSEHHDEPTSTTSLDGADGAHAALDVATHTSYARKKLEQLQERIDKKRQALYALKCSVKPESKVLQLLQKEMDWLRSEKRQTEAHLKRTDAWSEHLGKWKATIQSVEVCDEKELLQFMILVYVDEDINEPHLLAPNSATGGDNKPIGRPGSISSGWVVMRSLSQVQELGRKLRHVSPILKSFDLPTNFKLFFSKNDKNAVEKARTQVQKFINFILEDDHLNGSEAIYTFLSPSSDHLKQVLPSPKKSKFSLATLFKSDAAKAHEANKASDPFWGLQRDDEEVSTYLDGDTAGTAAADAKLLADLDGKDSIAEPLYALIGEIFDTGGLFKWVRKSIISFVQITYGRTINRQIRESLAYLFDEPMLHHYCSVVLKSFWPGGVLASAYPLRSDDMKEMTANAAKALLVDHVPEVLCNLVGAQAAKQGVLKLFDAIQNPNYNKQLFYELLEIVLIEIFPDIRQLIVTTNNSTSTNNVAPMATPAAATTATTFAATTAANLAATAISATTAAATITNTTTSTAAAAAAAATTATATTLNNNHQHLHINTK